MINCGENFRAGSDQVICPLCKKHPDSQFYLLQCPELTTELTIKFGENYSTNIEEVFNDNISRHFIDVVTYALEVRETKLQNK